jgi:hypothetical protein
VPLDGSAPAVAVVTGQGFVSALAADDVHLFWGSQPNGDGEVFQAAVDGTSPMLLATEALSTIESIAADSSTVYFASLYAAMGPPPDATATTGIFSLPIGGGTITRLGEYGAPLALDSAFIYFGRPNAVAKMPKAGGAVMTLLTSTSLESQFFGLGPTMVYAPEPMGQTTGLIVATPK